MDYDIDLARNGARLIAIDIEDGCQEQGQPCYEEPLRWNSQQSGFALGPGMQARERQRQMADQRQADDDQQDEQQGQGSTPRRTAIRSPRPNRRQPTNPRCPPKVRSMPPS